MEENQTNEIVNSDESRRSFMKKGALASGAVALGVGSTETVAAETTLQPSEILVFAYDYNPNLSFEPITTLQQGTTNGILSQIDSIGNSDDYIGYVIRYQPDGEYTLAFVRRPDSLSEGSLVFDPMSATFFDAPSNLLSVGVSQNGSGGNDDS